MRPLFACLSNEKARTYALILLSAGIPYQIKNLDNSWTILVSSIHRRRAVRAVALYLQENPTRETGRQGPEISGVKTYSALYIAPLLAVIHGAVRPGYEHQVFVRTFGADAGAIAAGSLYRCVTALLLHANWPHVVNNMVALTLFGTVAASSCGWGVGWLMILMAGVAGNLITAFWYQQGHVAIGASTAVFGAVGICCALNLWRHMRKAQPSWRMWLPLGAGMALLGLLGTSVHSDLMAHLWGFVSGLIIGGAYGWRYVLPPGAAVQAGAALMGAATIVISWLYGIYFAL